MKILAFAAALLASTSIIPVASSSANEALSAEACQPLTKSNLEACCSAENWRDLILRNDTAFCPPLSAKDDSGRLGEKLANAPDVDASVPDGVDVPDDVDIDDPDQPVTTGGIGNPGNGEQVGQAGEKGMNNENPSTGTRGKSN
jgi:hypothetical protein